MRRIRQARGGGVGRQAAGDRGAGTVLALALIGVVAAATVATATLGRVLIARHQAAAAADLAALAAAAALADVSASIGGASAAGGNATPSRDVACRRGARVAADNGGALIRCEVGAAGDVLVLVQVETGVELPALAAASAQARAGPSWSRAADEPG